MESISAELLETLTPKQYGEKGHIEYGWSNDTREKILQWSFQLVRTTDENMCKLERIYYELLYDLTIKYKFDDSKTILEKEIAFHLLKILYKMIGQVRDIVDGKGEYTLSYRMIYSWYFILRTVHLAISTLLGHCLGTLRRLQKSGFFFAAFQKRQRQGFCFPNHGLFVGPHSF